VASTTLPHQKMHDPASFLTSLDPIKYLGNFTASTVTSEEPHLQALINHLRLYGANNAFEYNDPVHGERTLPSWMLKVVATPPLLRLSQVGQMSLLPHSRLSHSIGVAILAIDLAQKYGLSDSDLKRLVLLSLLHDVRHGPYSHLFDHLYIDNKGNWFSHDSRLREFLNDDALTSALNHLGSNTDQIVQFLGTPRSNPYGYIVKEILDRIDYAIRDSMFSGRLLTDSEKSDIAGSARNLFDRIEFDSERRDFYFADEADTIKAIDSFLDSRQLAFSRLAFDENSRLTESLLYSSIKNILARPENLPNTAEQIVLALSYLSDRDLEGLLPPKAAAIFSQAKSGFCLGLVRIDGSTLTDKFLSLRKRSGGAPGPTKTILTQLKTLDPKADFLVAIVPQLSPRMEFKLRDQDGQDIIKAQSPCEHAGCKGSGIKCITISRYDNNGIIYSDQEQFRARVQSLFLDNDWIIPLKDFNEAHMTLPAVIAEQRS
jgi:hypothetical protein